MSEGIFSGSKSRTGWGDPRLVVPRKRRAPAGAFATIGTYQTARPLRHGPQRLVISALLVAAAAYGCGAPDNPTDDAGQPQSVPDRPSKPVSLEILDVAGNLQLTQGMIDAFVEQHPDIVKKVTYSKAPALDLVALRFVNPTQLVTRVRDERTR